jgi:hypothetical protein
MTAKELAHALAKKFLAQGSFAFAGPTSPGSHAMPATASAKAASAYFEESGFAGLSVQSVGFEQGVPDPKVHVYVTKGARKAVEHQIDDVDGDTATVVVHRIGKVMIRPEMASGATHAGRVYERNGRIACGGSCAPSGENYAGTIGALVRTSDNRLFVLSNNHVLAAANHVPVGMPILAPSTIDARPGVRAPGELCRHSQICELRSGEPALVPPSCDDIAIAEVVNQNAVSSWQGDVVDGFDSPAQIGVLRSNMRVKKVGRTTGLTFGTVEARIIDPFPMPYKCRHFAAVVWFTDVWTVLADQGTMFASPGDSGSLVVSEDGTEAMGLLFAVSSSAAGDYGIIIPMAHVVAQFGGLTLVSKHGV